LKILNAFRLIHIPSCSYYFAILNNILLSYLLRCIWFYRASACEHVRDDIGTCIFVYPSLAVVCLNG